MPARSRSPVSYSQSVGDATHSLPAAAGGPDMSARRRKGPAGGRMVPLAVRRSLPVPRVPGTGRCPLARIVR
jgi:hypothetical protein